MKNTKNFKHRHKNISDSPCVLTLQNRVKELEVLIKLYEEQLRLLKNKRFGSSSEKSVYDINQLSLNGLEELKLDSTTETSSESCMSNNSIRANMNNESDKGRVRTLDAFSDNDTNFENNWGLVRAHRRKKRNCLDNMPKDLPVEEVFCELPGKEQICPECDGHLHVMGRNTRDEVVAVPASVKIRRYVSHTYACRSCEKISDSVPMLKSKMPNPVIKGSFASPEIIAHIIYQKFVMAAPLYRQEKDWERQGIMLSRQTMANWLVRSTERWLKPIVNELKRRLLLREVLHSDETTLQVLREPNKSPQSKSYLWCYRTSGDAQTTTYYDKLKSHDENIPIVIAEYTPNRKGSNPYDFLAGFSGYLHADGYDVYHKLPENIVTVGCWAHARRKWDEALKVVPKEKREDCVAMTGKRYCDKMFAIERDLANLDADTRHSERLARLKPVINEFFKWAFDISALPKSPLGKAVTYMFSQQKYLRNVLLDGRLELSNNRVERSIRPFVICRKNFLFANTPRGASCAATIFSLIETAKEAGLNPFEYLVYVLKIAPNIDMNNLENLNMLLPTPWFKDNINSYDELCTN